MQTHPDLQPRLIVLRFGAGVAYQCDGLVLQVLENLGANRHEGCGFVGSFGFGCLLRLLLHLDKIAVHEVGRRPDIMCCARGGLWRSLALTSTGSQDFSVLL